LRVYALIFFLSALAASLSFKACFSAFFARALAQQASLFAFLSLFSSAHGFIASSLVPHPLE